MSLPLLEAGLVQTVFPNTFPVWTTGTLLPSTVYGGFVWAGHPLNTVLSGPDIYEAVFEISLIVHLTSLRAALSQQDLLLKGQDGVPGGGRRHRASLQPSSGCAAVCKHVVLALAGVGECDVMDLQTSPLYFSFEHHPPYHKGLPA